MSAIIHEIIKFLFFALCTAITTLIVILITSMDLQALGSIPEDSLTEYTQETLLAISPLLFLYKAKQQRMTGLYLVVGLLSCMFIRELDAVFDLIFHGAWKFFALPTALLCVYLALREGLASASDHLKRFTASTSYLFFIAGLITILIVSRIVGMRAIGEFIFCNNFHQSIKSFLEEGTELFGYIFLFMSSIGYCLMPNYKQTISEFALGNTHVSSKSSSN